MKNKKIPLKDWDEIKKERIDQAIKEVRQNTMFSSLSLLMAGVWATGMLAPVPFSLIIAAGFGTASYFTGQRALKSRRNILEICKDTKKTKKRVNKDMATGVAIGVAIVGAGLAMRHVLSGEDKSGFNDVQTDLGAEFIPAATQNATMAEAPKPGTSFVSAPRHIPQ